MNATSLRTRADYYYWAFTLRLVDVAEIASWATDVLATVDGAPPPLVELATAENWDTESVLEQLRRVPGENDSRTTFTMLMRLLAGRYFAGTDQLSYTLRLCEALHEEFSASEEPYSEVISMCHRWEGVEYGFGESEKEFRRAFEDFLRREFV